MFLELFLLEGEANAFFDREAWVDFGESSRGFFERESEGNEGIEGFVSGAFFRGESELGFGGAVMAREANFVAEVDNDALGGLFADASGFGNESGIGVGDGISDFFGGAETEDADGGFWTDTVYGNKHFKKFFSGEASEAIEVFGVFAEGVESIEFNFVAEIDALGIGSGED